MNLETPVHYAPLTSPSLPFPGDSVLAKVVVDRKHAATDSLGDLLGTASLASVFSF